MIMYEKKFSSVDFLVTRFSRASLRKHQLWPICTKLGFQTDFEVLITLPKVKFIFGPPFSKWLALKFCYHYNSRTITFWSIHYIRKLFLSLRSLFHVLGPKTPDDLFLSYGPWYISVNLFLSYNSITVRDTIVNI